MSECQEQVFGYGEPDYTRLNPRHFRSDGQDYEQKGALDLSVGHHTTPLSFLYSTPGQKQDLLKYKPE